MVKQLLGAHSADFDVSFDDCFAKDTESVIEILFIIIHKQIILTLDGLKGLVSASR